MLNQVNGCFDKKPVNFGRQKELDIAKGIAVILMVFSHSFESLVEYIDPGTSTIIAHGVYISVFGGVFAAPVFMFCMGVSFVYSRRNTANDMFHRALNTVGVVVLMEIARTVIPQLMNFSITGDTESLFMMYLAFPADILQFAALAMFVIALFKKLNLRPITMVIISIICSIVGQLLQGVSTGSLAGDIVAGFIWHTYEESYFPLLNWLIFPVCGYAFGDIWLRLRDKDTFFRWITPISWGVTAVYFASMAVVGKWYYLSGGDFYGLGILDAMFAFVVCFAMIGLGYYIAKWGGHVADWFGSMGIRVTSIYCIHWTIYGFMIEIVDIMGCTLALWTMVPISISVLIVSDIMSRYYVNLKASRRNRVKGANNRSNGSV